MGELQVDTYATNYTLFLSMYESKDIKKVLKKNFVTRSKFSTLDVLKKSDQITGQRCVDVQS